MKVFLRIGCLGIFLVVGCGGGSGTSTTTATQTPSGVSSITLSPASATLNTGTIQQFTATATGYGPSPNLSVTWSVLGDGTASSTGLFTAGSTAGTASVIATSVEDSTVAATAIVTVSAVPVSFGNWYGNLTSTDGTQMLPMDFSLTRTGNNLTSPNQAPVFVIATNLSQISSTPCENFYLPTALGFTRVVTASLYGVPLGGTINGQSISMTWTPASTTVSYPITLTGTLSQDGQTIVGTFTKTAFGCFANVTGGTFSFTQYPMMSGNFSGTFPYGTSTNVPFTINGGGAGITVGAIPATNCPASSYSMLGEQYGRFFHLWEADVAQGSTPLVVWGIANNVTDTSLDAYVIAQLNGYGGTLNPCFEPLSVLQTTLTAQ